jgi:eukaryotic-like serine/threonine-protein kinase
MLFLPHLELVIMTHSTPSLRELFDQALNLGIAERGAWIEQLNVDAALKIELKKLLAAEQDSQAVWLDEKRPNIGELVQASPHLVHAVPDQIGAYQVIELIGAGGMAKVYRAMRRDDSFKQTVAIKVLNQSMHGQLEAKLFQRERQVLAELDHPNIARLIDGGLLASEQPYLVMEFVPGMTLLAHCNAQKLALRDRVALFCKICDGVQAAHRALIVHRDIKPANIMVNERGEPKLLDFGVAKLLGPDDATQTFAPMTPAYAAPEQFDGGKITASTDVYALGMVLHELLAGSRRAKNDTTRASEIAKRNQTTSLETVRFLRGDIDNILRKAMQAEPNERYATAGDLALDLRRFLTGQAVLAHPPSGWYRLKKFARRNQWGVAVSVGFAILGLIASVIAWNNLQAERRASTQESIALRRAQTVRSFLEHLFVSVREGRSVEATPSVRDLVKLGAEQLKQRTDLDDRTWVELMTLFANLHENVGELETANKLAQAAVQRANERLDNADPIRVAAVAMRGFVRVRFEQFDDAAVDLDDALAKMTQQGTRGTALIQVLESIQVIQNWRGQREAYLASTLRALREYEYSYSPNDARFGTAYNNMGSTYEGLERYDDARAWYEKAVAFEAQYRPQSESHALAIGGLASTQMRSGRWLQANALFNQAHDIYALIEGKPQITKVYGAQKHCRLAAELLETKALQICQAALALSHSDPAWQGDVQLDSRFGLLFLRLQQGESAQLVSDLEALHFAYGSDAKNSSRRGTVALALGSLALYAGDFERAKQWLASAPTQLEQRAYRMAPLLARASLLVACKPIEQACNALKPAILEARSHVASWHHPHLLQVDLMLAETDIAPLAERSAWVQQSLLDAKQAFRPEHPRLVEGELVLAALRAQSGSCAAIPDAMKRHDKQILAWRSHPFVLRALRRVNASTCATPRSS